MVIVIAIGKIRPGRHHKVHHSFMGDHTNNKNYGLPLDIPSNEG